MTTQRDVILSELLKYAKEDSNVILISVDMGAPALDAWRAEMKSQFIPVGISEQHAINFAAGLSSGGKKVFVYFMACWLSRCLEQVRYSCAMAGNPITILGNGIGLGYAPAGPAHEPTDDIAYARSVNGLEIISPSTLGFCEQIVPHLVNTNALRYLRLERSLHSALTPLGQQEGVQPTSLRLTQEDLVVGFRTIADDSLSQAPNSEPCDVTILASGYMLGSALEVSTHLEESGIDTQVIDLWRIKPISHQFKQALKRAPLAITIEEQSLPGGFGGAVLEFASDHAIPLKVLRFGLPERYIFENGNRGELLEANGLGATELSAKALTWVKTNLSSKST
jgi:transketolase